MHADKFSHSRSHALALSPSLSLSLSPSLSLPPSHTLTLLTVNTEVPSKEDISSMGIGALKAFVSQWGCQAHKDDMAHIVGKLQHNRAHLACPDKVHTLPCHAMPCLDVCLPGEMSF